MVGQRRWTCASTLGPLAYVLTCAQAAAEVDRGDPVLIDYQAPPGCPSEREFGWRVSARVPHARVAREGEIPRTFIVRIELVESNAVGHLTIREPDGHEAERVMDADDCAELADALALIVALAIDPHALDPIPAPPPRPPKPPPVRVAPEREPWRFDVGVHAMMVTAVGPGPMFGPQFTLGVSVPYGFFGLPWSARGGFAYPFTQTFANDNAEFEWLAASLEICPVVVSLLATLRARPCVTGELGARNARGHDAPDPEEAEAPWRAGGLAGYLAWKPVPPLFVEAGGAVLAVATQDDFLVGSRRVHETPLLPAFRLRVGVGLEF